ncbi:hypothetical protein SDC9_110909 [bioreactor metagenome]|uniref:Uncharacterized protein n=1 Tax=bioreactor metagenome TaxID=1076179 RepID=A0A645BLA9_9ZZZZ
MVLRGAVAPLRVILRAEIQLFVCAVFHLPQLRGHDIFKNKVGRVQNLPAGAEVLRQKDFPFLPLPRVGMVLEGGVFPQENGGVRQPEAIDGLLHVSHGEKVPSPVGHCLKNVVLDLVGILILVHQNLHIAGGNLLPQFRGRSVLPCQKLQRQMLLIGKVRLIQPQLFLPVAPGKLPRQLQ